MLNKLEEAKQKYDELMNQLSEPDIIADNDRYNEICRVQSTLEPIVNAYHEYKGLLDEKNTLEALLDESSSQDREWISEELKSAKEKIEQAEADIRMLLLPRDPDDGRNVVMEIRAGAGGEEAALFAADLYRMYTHYAERSGLKYEEVSVSDTDLGGLKEAVFMLSGKDAYRRLRFESGVHRVQRVPSTESGGRIHTSTVTVAVLPEAGDIEVQINQSDLRIDTYRASGAGGQHINKTDSAIRITHEPTGIVVTCQSERSQIQNRETAMRMLKSRLYDMYRAQADSEMSENRRSQVGTGERCERIRTYNFPQNRVTDHRIGLTLYKLDRFIDGDMDDIIQALLLDYYRPEEA